MSAEILALQKRLKAAGYDPGPLDGVMGPKTQAAINAEKSGTPPSKDSKVYSADWSDADIASIGAIFKVLDTTPEAVFPVIMYESGARPNAQNPRPGHATGLIQWMDFNLKAMGYTPEQFKQFSIAQQLPFVLKYFMPHAGKLVNSTAVYMVVWQPAYVKYAGDPNWTHPSWHKDYKGGSPNNVYNSNPGFDKAKRGYIVVGDLRDTADSMLSNPRTQELIRRTNAVMGREKVGMLGTGIVVGLGFLAYYVLRKLVGV